MSRLPIKYFSVFICCLLSLLNSYSQKAEHILNYHSDIRIDKTGQVIVTENIKVDVTGRSIKRGIVRSIPTTRTDINNIERRIDIKVLSILKDGKEETFSTKEVGNQKEIYIGRENYELSPQIYNYTITYSSIGHIGFFDNYDEIYWNVTGNDWAFPIDTVSATVYLPQGAKFIDNACYTGKEGSKASNCTYKAINDNTVEFYGSSSLKVKEGLTIATSFTPGIIARPSKVESFWENYGLLSMLVLGLLSFYVYVLNLWKKINVNKKPIVIPTFNPPGGMSAATIRYLYKKGFDSKVYTTCILSLAVKKSLSIKKEDDSYRLTALGVNDSLSEEELDVYKTLFPDDKQTIELDEEEDIERSEDAFDILVDDIDQKIKLSKDYYPSKVKSIINTILFSAALIFLWFFIAYQTLAVSSKSILSIVIFTLFLMILVITAYFNRKPIIVFCGICLFIIPLTIAQITLFREGGFYTYSLIFIWLLFAANCFIFKYLKPRTQKGFDFDNELEGFKQYLTIAEENRLNFLTPPEHTPEQFEKMLPYAVALDLEIEWAKKFTKELNQSNYSPTWYEGEAISSYSVFTKNLSTSVTKKIDENSSYLFDSDRNSSSGGGSSSGSSSWSSGSRGGGSSGGGGGGGGGHGW